VIFILNHFFEALGGVVTDAGGSPDRFIGDGDLRARTPGCARTSSGLSTRHVRDRPTDLQKRSTTLLPNGGVL
jgi:hypothetical protein